MGLQKHVDVKLLFISNDILSSSNEVEYQNNLSIFSCSKRLVKFHNSLWPTGQKFAHPCTRTCSVSTPSNPQTTSSVHMVSYTLAYVLGSILPSIPADRLFARPTCRCSGQNGRLSGCIFWNKCRRSNCHCR